MNETQLALEIGLMGRSKAVSFLQSLLSRMQGNVTQAAAANEPPIHGMTAAEDAASDEQAVKDWNKPEPKTSFDHAVNYIFTHPGCRSGEVKRHVKEVAGITDNQWANVLLKLSNDRRVRKEGQKINLTWHTV